MSGHDDTYTPRVSVLMACYNASRWLQVAVDSVLNQTFDEFEFVIIDDGSTDETPGILEDNRHRDSRIVVVRRRHSGLAKALNAGIEVAKGRWIARLDADDICEPTRIETQIAFAESNEFVLVGSGFTEIGGSGDRIRVHRYPRHHRRLVRRLHRSQGFFPHSSAFYERRAARHVGSYNPRFEKSQDRDLWLRLSRVGRLACLPEPLVSVRKHDANVTSSRQGYDQAVFGTVASICALLASHGATDPSTAADDARWRDFVAWAAGHPEMTSYRRRRQRWQEARAAYFGERGRLSGLVSFISSLVASGDAPRLVIEKLLGSSVPARLARQWESGSCAES